MVTEVEVITSPATGNIKWHVHLKDGWNSVWAKTEKAALKLAEKEFDDWGVKGVSPMTKETEKHLMSLFY